MWKKINNWTLPFLVFGVSVLSILLIYKIVWAQFVPPDSQPGDTIEVGLTMNPMAADLDLNNKSFIDSALTDDPATKKGVVAAVTSVLGKAAIYGETGNSAAYAIYGKGVNGAGIAGYFEGDLCLNGNCINAWPTSGSAAEALWISGNAGKILYATSTSANPDGNAELEIKSGALDYWALYHSKLDASGDLRFWNTNVPGDKNALTLKTSGDVAIANGNLAIGTASPGARLDVRSAGTGDILNLYDGTTNKVFSVVDGGGVGVGVAASYPTAKFNIDGTGATNALDIANTSNAINITTSGNFGNGINITATHNWGGYGLIIVAQGPDKAAFFNGAVDFVDSSATSKGVYFGNLVTFNRGATISDGDLYQLGGYYRMRYSGVPPGTTDCNASDELGRIYLDSVNNKLYVCSGPFGGPYAWKYTTLN